MSYFANRIKYRAALLASVVLLLTVMLLSSTIGNADIGVLEALNIVASKIPGAKRLLGNDIVDSTQAIIVLNIRMPRIFLAAAIGALLSIIGGCFQGLFKNPMADSYVLGISNGAGLGATIAIVFGLNISWNVLGLGMVSIMAFAGAFVTAVTVFAIARVGGRLPTVNLLLTGIAVGLFEYSIITILMVFNRDKIEGIIMWLMGSAEGFRNTILEGLKFTGVKGYEIHMGKTDYLEGCIPFLSIKRFPDEDSEKAGGMRNKAGNVFGTYIHGIFDNTV
jgi:iron complex transport system permease protein